MCGIFGFFSSAGPISSSKVNLLDKSLEALHHRGPDSHGTFVDKEHKVYLSHTRLAINDLSPCGAQPMRLGQYVIVFNGEIYNFKELKKVLIEKYQTSFKSNSDTEVLLELYKIHKEKCLDLLQGMFAFCIYDEIENTFFIARDPIGEKPLVFSEQAEGFLFSSEIPAILKCSDTKIQPNLKNLLLIDAGNHRHIPDPYTLWENVFRLMPGHFMIVRNGKIQKMQKWWDISQDLTTKNSSFRDLIISAVEQTTVSDVPYTILLSGGIDSSIIAYILKNELNKNFEAFVYGKDENDEEVLRAKFVAKHLNIPLKVIEKKDVSLNDFDKVVEYYGEPLPLLPLLFNMGIMREIQKTGYKVILTGNGADEVFFGYTGHSSTYLKTHKLDALPLAIKKKLFPLLKFSKNYSSKDLEKLKLTYKWFKEVNKTVPVHNSYIDYSNYFGLISENAHSVCISSDIASSIYGLEQRSPFLSKKLVEKAFHTSVEDKLLNNGKINLKNILKTAFANDLPEAVFTNKKMGFGFNSKEDLFGMNTKDLINNEILRWRNFYGI